jgi:chaperonin cofactor prefoldin
MKKKQTVEQDFNLAENRPLAGETRTLPLGQALFFSPKPSPTAKIAPGSWGESNQVVAINDTYMDIGQGNQGTAEQVQFVMSLPDEIRYQLSLIGSQLSGLVIDELNTLTDSLKAAQTKGNALVYHARPGLVALLLGQKKNTNVTLEMGVEAGNAFFNEKFTQLEQIRFDAEKILSQRNSVEAQLGGACGGRNSTNL